MWTGTSTGGTLGSAALDQRGTFVPLSGDFNADGYGDIYWYQPGPDPKLAVQAESGSNWEPNARKDELWLGRSFGWSKSNLSQTWAAAPTVGDFDGNGTTDILWAQPGNAADSIWFFGTNGVPAARTLSLYGYYRPVVGDLDGDGVDDIFWYGPGSAADSIWWFNANGGFTKTNVSVTGTQFRPFAGDFDGNGRDDIIWYAPGPGFDSRWVNINRSGTYTKVSQTDQRHLHPRRRRLRRQRGRRHLLVRLSDPPGARHRVGPGRRVSSGRDAHMVPGTSWAEGGIRSLHG